MRALSEHIAPALHLLPAASPARSAARQQHAIFATETTRDARRGARVVRGVNIGARLRARGAARRVFPTEQMVCKQETAANASERAAPLLRTEGDNHVTADHAKRSTNLPRLLSTGSSPAPRSIRSLLVDDYPTAHKPSRSSQPAPPPPVLEATHGNRDASQPIPTMSTSSPANPGSTRPTETPQQSRAGRMPQGDSPDIDQQQPQTPTSRSFDGPGGTVVHQHIQHYRMSTSLSSPPSSGANPIGQFWCSHVPTNHIMSLSLVPAA